MNFEKKCRIIKAYINNICNEYGIKSEDFREEVYTSIFLNLLKNNFNISYKIIKFEIFKLIKKRHWFVFEVEMEMDNILDNINITSLLTEDNQKKLDYLKWIIWEERYNRLLMYYSQKTTAKWWKKWEKNSILPPKERQCVYQKIKMVKKNLYL